MAVCQQCNNYNVVHRVDGKMKNIWCVRAIPFEKVVVGVSDVGFPNHPAVVFLGVPCSDFFNVYIKMEAVSP